MAEPEATPMRRHGRERTNVSQRSKAASASVLDSLDTMTDSQVAWSANFHVFAFAHAVNMGTATTAFDLQAFVLNDQVFGIGTGLLFLGIIISSLVAGGTLGIMGPKRGATFAMAFMVAYFVFLAAAAYAGECTWWQWPLYLPGALGCAVAVAHLGACVGPWVDRTATALCRETPELSYESASGHCVTNYAIIGYGIQAGLMMMLTALQLGFGWEEPPIILIYGAMCLFGITVMFITREPPPVDDEKCTSVRDGVRVVLSYYKDPRALLLSLFPMATGCMSSWKTSGLTHVLGKTLGKNMIGVVMIAQTVATLIFAKLCEHMMRHFGNSFVLLLGTVMLVVGPSLYLFTDLAFQGWWILLFFILVGMAHAVAETAVKSTVLSHFRGEMSATAFSALTMQNFLGGMIFYFMNVFSAGSATMDECASNGTAPFEAAHVPAADPRAAPVLQRDSMSDLEAKVMIVLALLVMPCLFLANSLEAKQLIQYGVTESDSENSTSSDRSEVEE